MHKIYFEKRCLAICSPQDPALSDPNAVLWYPGGAGMEALVCRFRDAAHLVRVLVPTEDEEGTYRAVCALFREVNAAGGLVSNRRDDVLLIRRGGLWDLPKGHQEADEDIRITALREVREETGVDRLVLGELRCVTDHCYLRGGVWHLKHTWWFDMLYTDPVDLTPQTEEDITRAAWVARSSLAPYLKNTYPSIAEVFREGKS